MTCRCAERADYLKQRNIPPIFGNSYTAMDFARYVAEKAAERVRGR